MKSLSDTRFSFDNRNDIDILTDENRSILQNRLSFTGFAPPCLNKAK